MVKVFGVGGRHGRELRQFDDEVAGAQVTACWHYNAVEIRDGVPVRRFRALLNPVAEFRGRAGVWASVQSDIDENVGVRKDH